MLFAPLAAKGMQCGGDVPSGTVGQNLPFADLDVCCRKSSILITSKAHVEQPSLDDPAVTGVPSCRLTLPNDLDNLTPSQTEVSCHRVRNLHTRQLRFLQTIPFQQFGFLLGAQQNMLRDEFVASNVDQQILLLEVFADAAGDTAQQAHGGGGDRGLGNENSGVEVVFVDKVVECADLFGTYTRGVGAEFNVDSPAIGLRVRVRFAR